MKMNVRLSAPIRSPPRSVTVRKRKGSTTKCTRARFLERLVCDMCSLESALHKKSKSNDVFLACGSRRKHKAWGASPRIVNKISAREPAIAGDSADDQTLSPVSRLLVVFVI